MSLSACFAFMVFAVWFNIPTVWKCVFASALSYLESQTWTRRKGMLVIWTGKYLSDRISKSQLLLGHLWVLSVECRRWSTIPLVRIGGVQKITTTTLCHCICYREHVLSLDFFISFALRSFQWIYFQWKQLCCDPASSVFTWRQLRKDRMCHQTRAPFLQPKIFFFFVPSTPCHCRHVSLILMNLTIMFTSPPFQKKS